MSIPRTALAFACVAASVPFAAGAAEALQASALTAQYCVVCHSDAARVAGVTLEGRDPEAVHEDPALWETVLRKVASGEMPPSDMPSPGTEALASFAEALEVSLDRFALDHPNPGRTPSHRLNRAEYANAVRDLLDLDVDIESMLPGDDSGYGFDNIADVLTISPTLLDRYMLAARRVSRLAMGTIPAEPQKDIYVRNRETGFREAGHAPPRPGDRPLGSGGGASLRYYFPASGKYLVEAALDHGDSRRGYQQHSLELDLEAGMHLLGFNFPRGNARVERSQPRASAVVSAPHPPLDIRIDGKRHKLIEMGESTSPFKLRWISVEGPFDPRGSGSTPSRRRILTCEPGQDGLDAETCARQILARLARYAYRRPVVEADISSLMGVYASGALEGGFEHGITRALQALLVAPGFLYRIEDDPEGVEPGQPYRLSDLELASRLSFFLWSSLPDEELLQAAEDGQLTQPDAIERQVRRMLADPRSDAMVKNFAGQWLQLRKVDKVKPDEVLFPEFDDELRQAMRRETELFFADILRENRSVFELLDSKRAFLNGRLAAHYGLPAVHGPQFREVALEDPRRGGLLGQGSVLTVTSYPNRTSVVIRGQWVLENLFGMPPPPPPPDIPELEEAAEEGEQRTLRELMTLHSRSPTCASCHVRMDPIGFALENFDAVGRWRERDGEHAIDASGELPGGVTFRGPGELKQVLSTELRGSFARTAVEKLLTYALGRGLEYYDRATVRAIVREAEQFDYRLADLVVAVARSMPFGMRAGAG